MQNLTNFFGSLRIRVLNPLMAGVLVFVLIFGIVGVVSTQSGPQPVDPPEAKPEIVESYGKLPLYFIENQGQVDQKVKFYEKSSGHMMFFSEERIYIRLRRTQGESAEHAVIMLMALGMEEGVELVAEEPQEGKVNYFIGNDPNQWRTSIPTYRAVVYREAYPGIDLKFYGNNQQLEYDIVVKRGGDPSRVTFEYTGIEDLEITEQGNLSIRLKDGGVLVQRKPIVYQEIAGKRVEVDGRFKIHNDHPHVYGFEVASYDKNYPLVIDPILVYSTFLGGSERDMGKGIAVDALGYAYVTGHTHSSDFPTTPAAFDASFNGGPLSQSFYGGDVFVTKLEPTGSSLVYSTYLGGELSESGEDIAVDASGNAYVTGSTFSNDFPTTSGAFDTYRNPEYWAEDAFLTKLDPTGSLSYSTFLGGG